MSLTFLHAQQPTTLHSIRGAVKDKDGAVLTGATINVQSTGANQSNTLSARTAADGTYVVPALPAGPYQVIATADLFAPSQAVVTLNGSDATQDFTLTPATAMQSIQVNATSGYIATTSSTATRLPVSWLDVPQNIQTVTPELIQQQAAFQLSDAVSDVSGVSRTNTGSGSISNQFTIRGFQLDGDNSFLRDGMKYPSFGISDLADVEQVEVLKGPSSVLYGRAQPGGVINLVSKKPLPTRYASLQYAGANDDFARPEFDLGGPIVTPRLSYRLNGSYQHDLAFIDLVHREHYFLAPSILLTPTSSTSLLVRGELADEDATSEYGVPAIGNRPAPVRIQSFYGEAFNLGDTRPRQAAYNFRQVLTPNWSLENRFSYSASGYSYYEAYPYSVEADGHTVDRLLDNYAFPENFKYSQTEVAGTVKLGPIRNQVLAGFEAGWQHSYFTGAQVNGPSIDLYHPVYGSVTKQQAIVALNNIADPSYYDYNSDSRNQTQAGYVQDLVKAGNKLTFLGGARFENFAQQDQDYIGLTTIKSAAIATSPRIGVVYAPIANTSLYFNYLRSFNPVDPSNRNQSGQPFAPVRAQQYEGGLKRLNLSGHLQTTLAVYWIQEKNVLTTDPNNSHFSIATGTQRSKGIDLDLVGELRPGWNAYFSYAFNQAQVTQDNTYPVGNFLAETPRHSANLWTTYSFQQSKLHGLGFGGGVYGRSYKEGNLNNDYILPGYGRLDMTAYYERANGEHSTWRLAFNIHNALDKHFFEASNGGDFVRAATPLAAYTSLRYTWR
jgi:iron complex outermembrane receptor protein